MAQSSSLAEVSGVLERQGPALRRAPDAVAPGVAVLRSPVLFVLIALAVTAAAVAASWARPITYTAESRLLVGQVDTEARSVPGYTKAAQDLAAVYARVVPTDVVVGPVAAQAGAPPDTVRSAISASPIPDAAIVRVEARAGSSEQARQLADLAATSLADYVHRLSAAEPTDQPEFKAYAAAANAYAVAQFHQQALQQQVDQMRATTTASVAAGATSPGDGALEVAQVQMVAATSDVLQKKLQVDSLSEAYRNAVRGTGDRSGLRPVAAAADTGSDRMANLQIGVLTGAVAGGLLALGVVTLRANGRRLRLLRRGAVA
jgi:hypothetical protein